MGYQNPKLDKYGAVWCIRARLPRLDGRGGMERRLTRITLGPWKGTGAISKAEALTRRADALAKINNKALVIGAQVKFADIVWSFRRAHLPTLKVSTAKKYESVIQNHILPAFADVPVAEMDRATVREWLATYAERAERSSIETYRNCLSAIFSYAEDANLWNGRNPCERVKVPKTPGRRPAREDRILTAEEFRRYLERIEDTEICSAADARLINEIAVVTTMRVGEILALTGGDITPGDPRIEVKRRVYRGDFDTPKTARSARTVFVGASILADLEARRRGPDDLIFSRANGDPLDDRDMQQHVFRPAAERAGVYFRGFGLHKLRCAAITWRQTVAGATPMETMKLAGHSTLAMTRLYTKNEAARLIEQSEILTDLVRPSQTTGRVM